MNIFGTKRRDAGPDAGDVRPVVRRPSYVSQVASKRLTYDEAGTRLLKVAVVFLCSVNTVMWEYYTQSRMMAMLWAAIAVGFVVWIVKDMRR
jgi:membrane protein YdbS with pleckstrin-like domain